MFRPFAGARTVRWRALVGEGLEHLTIEPFLDRIEARAVVLGETEGVAYGARYRVVCDTAWQVMEFTIEMTDGRMLALCSPQPGHWTDAQGSALPGFDGCVDIDLSASPFTNTLPIRRLALSPADGATELEMLFVRFNTLSAIRDPQRYTCLESSRRYWYEAADGSFEPRRMDW